MGEGNLKKRGGVGCLVFFVLFFVVVGVVCFYLVFVYIVGWWSVCSWMLMLV